MQGTATLGEVRRVLGDQAVAQLTAARSTPSPGLRRVLAAQWAVLGLGLGFIAAAPYTKVEESFGLQASHDLLYTGRLAQFDHFEFPGVVPRSFVGPIALAGLAGPAVALIRLLGLPKLWALLAVRAGLLVLVWLPLRALTRQLGRRYGAATAGGFVLAMCAQFHFLFYASRTLPNSFALVPVLWGIVCWEAGNWRGVVYLMAFATVVFRCDVLVLAGPVGLVGLCTGELGLLPAVRWGLQAVLASAALSFAVDSFMWQRPLCALAPGAG